MNTRPTICLNMIVRNEAHVVQEVLDCVGPHIDYWVVVDTGSDDGTQGVIQAYMESLGIPGEIHERSWRNFGANRSEALDLAQGHCDYIWIIDADDLIVGDIDLSRLTADAYELRIGKGFTYWRTQIVRSGLPWSYRGVVHEYLHCGQPFTQSRLEGDYHIESRRLGNRSTDPEKYARDRDLLLAELERNPDDERSVFYLAQSYLDYGDVDSALKWYRRRAEMGRWVEEVYFSLYRVAECLDRLNEPWPAVLDAYLRAWAYRPERAEPLCAIASHYMNQREWQLGYFFAEHASKIPLPSDILFVNSHVYLFSALDVQAVCAYWLGKHDEVIAICRQLLDLQSLPVEQRERIASNRDFSIRALQEAAKRYPESLARSFSPGAEGATVTVTITGGDDRLAIERTVNSVLQCCSDLSLIALFVLVNVGLDETDVKALEDAYPFLKVVYLPEKNLTDVRAAIDTRYWMYVPEGWEFFLAGNHFSRLIAVLKSEPDVDQVGVNRDDAEQWPDSFYTGAEVKYSAATGRYLIAERRSHGPAMFDITRPQMRTATLDDVLLVRRSKHQM